MGRRAAVDGSERDVVMSNVYYGERLAQNLVARVFEVFKVNDVLLMNTVNAVSARSTENMDLCDGKRSGVYAALEQAEKANLECAPVKCMLMELHEQLGHLMFDMVGKMADAPGIGGVVCSDLKRPMNLMDRNGNKYLINFVDHHTNYCRVFVAKRKDLIAKAYERFLAYF
ncbi:Mitochondrial Carrier (MC) Family [Phytophthora cinnamomi]|uniref:Mitochondrial Carrier (MC) Family n=1 Tax=Phytophthora cinnamomi TaxID=4785 RepID=UPI0035596C82|nr:Mitochondrial Carrier (MC) Family [Phytophthora cinnamomi]